MSGSKEGSGPVVIRMDPHKRTLTIGVMTRASRSSGMAGSPAEGYPAWALGSLPHIAERAARSRADHEGKMRHMSTETRLDRWQRHSEWPHTAAALVFLVAYAWPILAPDLPADVREVVGVAAWAAWGLFLIDYLVRLGLATNRGRFVVRHIFDLLVVILPLLRPLRLLRPWIAGPRTCWLSSAYLWT